VKLFCSPWSGRGVGCTQRPRLAAVLAFEKRRARQLSPIELLILKIIQL